MSRHVLKRQAYKSHFLLKRRIGKAKTASTHPRARLARTVKGS